MVRINHWFLLATLSLLMMSCSSKPCRGIVLKKPLLKKEEVFKDVDPNSPVIETVKVYKYDGSLQCGMGKSFPLKDMAIQLGKIRVISMSKMSDNLMHITVCGSPTGKANVYEIEKKDLKAARAIGFELWTFGR